MKHHAPKVLTVDRISTKHGSPRATINTFDHGADRIERLLQDTHTHTSCYTFTPIRKSNSQLPPNCIMYTHLPRERRSASARSRQVQCQSPGATGPRKRQNFCHTSSPLPQPGTLIAAWEVCDETPDQLPAPPPAPAGNTLAELRRRGYSLVV